MRHSKLPISSFANHIIMQFQNAYGEKLHIRLANEPQRPNQIGISWEILESNISCNAAKFAKYCQCHRDSCINSLLLRYSAFKIVMQSPKTKLSCVAVRLNILLENFPEVKGTKQFHKIKRLLAKVFLTKIPKAF